MNCVKGHLFLYKYVIYVAKNLLKMWLWVCKALQLYSVRHNKEFCFIDIEDIEDIGHIDVYGLNHSFLALPDLLDLIGLMKSELKFCANSIF